MRRMESKRTRREGMRGNGMRTGNGRGQREGINARKPRGV